MTSLLDAAKYAFVISAAAALGGGLIQLGQKTLTSFFGKS